LASYLWYEESARIVLILLLFPALLSVAGGRMGAPGFLHPEKRALTPDMVRDADARFGQIGAHREEFDLRAADGAMLRGWKCGQRRQTVRGCWCFTEWPTIAME
jgi:hypothetical protein